jgi:hypothetical protein
VPVLAPGTGKTKTGRLWAYLRDERPFAGARPPAALFFYSPDRKGEHPQAHLKDFRGVIHADGYAGFKELFGSGRIVEAGCWAHVRRKFFDVHAATGSAIAKEALDRIGQLYAVEKTIYGSPPKWRQHRRLNDRASTQRTPYENDQHGVEWIKFRYCRQTQAADSIRGNCDQVELPFGIVALTGGTLAAVGCPRPGPR